MASPAGRPGLLRQDPLGKIQPFVRLGEFLTEGVHFTLERLHVRLHVRLKFAPGSST